MADREDQLDPQITEVDETPPWAARDTEQAAPPPEEPPVGVSETARQLESEGFFDRMAFKKSIDDAAARSEAVAKSAGSQGILGESFGLLTPGESRAWLKEARTEFDAKEQRWAEFRSGPIERGRANVEGMFGDKFAEATKPTLEGADADVAKQRAKRGRELSEMEAGTRAPAMKTPLRSAVENVPQGAIDLAGSIVKGVGIGAGFAGRELGMDIAPDDNTTYSLGKWIEAKGKELFPGDIARQEEFTQKLAHGAGSMIGFYGPAIAGKLIGASDKALIGITMATGSLAEGSETYEQALQSAKAGRDVSEGAKALAFMGGLILGTWEALPIAHMFNRRMGLARGMAIQGLEEGLQEGGQTLGENVIAQTLHDPERPLTQGVGESMAIGSILGTFMQGAQYAASKQARVQARPQPAPAATPTPAVEPPAEPEKPKQETPANAYDVKQFYDGTEEPSAALGIAAMAVRKTPETPEDEQPSLADEIAAAQPQLEPWQQKLSETLVEIAKQTEANRPALEQDVEANLPTYTSAIKDVYAGHGLPYALADDAVRSVAINMAQGLTAEEALKRYAAEGYEQERAPRAQGAGTSPTSADARGARQGSPAAPGVGSLGDRLQSSAAALQSGGPKRGVQQADVSDYEQHYQRALRASFRAIVASRRPANEWGKFLKLKPDELKALVDEAVRDGLLRIDRNGVIRRTKLAKVAPKETPIRPGEDIANTPPDIRARDAIAKREEETGKQIAPDVRRWAQNIEETIGRPAFAEQMSLMREAARTGELSLADMLDLTAMVGLRDIIVAGKNIQLSKMTKAGALLAIQRKHDMRVQERQAAIAAAKFEFDTGIKAMAVKRPGLPDERVRRGIERSRMADTLRQLATDAGAALGDEAAFPAVLRRLKAAAKKMSKADALELARLVGYQPKSRTTKAQALQSITLRHQDIVESRAQAQAIAEAQEAANAERQALLQSQGAVPEGELPEGVSETAGVGGTGGAPGAGGPGGGRDVARPGSPDVDGQGSPGELSGEGAGTRDDTREGARDGDAGTDLRSARPVVDTAAVRAQVEADAARAEQARADRVANNYTITDADEIGKGGPKAKVRANLAAIRTLRQIEEEKRPATAGEKKVLVKYVGWGAFAQDVFATHKPEWAKERAELQNLLSPEEYKSARASTLNAHFTSPEVIKGMWSALEWLGFKGGRAIEPAAGIGHFIGLQPENMRADTNWTAVELDKISGGITKALYGASDVRVGGFEEQVWPDNYFDLAVSNVPFGDFKIEDTERKGYLIHDYFFVKALAKVRPGGIVAFITSAGTLDKQGGAARRAMDKQGTFLGAIRLPGGNKGAFKANAGTDVTTDIVFFRKRIPGEPVDVNSEWRDLAEVNTPEGKTSINGYFAANPKMMLGKMRLIGTMYGKGEPVLIGPTDNLESSIAEAAQRMPEDAMLPATTSAAAFEEKVDTEVDAIKEGAFYAKDGQIFRKITGVGHPQKLNKANAERVTGFIGMRDTVNRMLAIQSGAAKAADGEMDSLRAALNADYDAFVKKFGPINLTHITETKRKKDGKVITTRRMPNFSPIEDDNDAYKVKALEVYDEKTQKATKAAIFTEDVVGSYTRPAVTGPSDALAVSLNETGRVDMALIADQLGVGEAEAAAVLGDRVYQNPAGGQWQTAAQYLSGDVVKKLADAKASAELDESYARNVTALEEVQPEPLSRAEITVPFGASWVPAEVYEAFLQDVVGSEFKVTLNEVTKQWRVAQSRRSSEAAQAQWGTDRKSVGEIVEAALNSKPIIITDKQRDGNSVRDIAGETAARAKVELLREAFTGQTFPGAPAAVGGWVWNDDARAMRLEELYNLGFNRIVKEDHDGAHLTFPGLARVVTFPDGATGTINLTPARTSAIWRIIQNGNTLIDHVVGAGKTWTSIMAVMEMKRLGMVRRPMFVVPNHMLHQFSNEFLQAYPAAKLLVATKDNMSAAKRKEFAAKAAAEKWDGIIITHSAFGRLRMRDEAYVAYYEEAIERMIEAKDRAATEEGKDSATVKDIEKARKRLKAKLEKFTAKEKKDLGITFEELGVDHLTVDEAHLFKNLWFPTRHTRVRGISNATESQRATDLYIKIRNLEKSKPGRSTLFLTGTPLSNTMAEVYTMMRYLQHDTLEEYGIGEFDSWAQTFGNIKTKTELAPNGRDFRDTTSFGEFVNIPELATLYGRIADTQTAESLKLPRPKLKGDKPIVVETELAPSEEQFVQDLIAKMESLKGKRPERGSPNFLSLFTQGLQVGTDFRLVDPSASYNPNGKIAKAVDNIFSVWERGNKDEKTPDKAQLVFLDMGVPGSKGGKRIAAKAAEATEEPIDAVRRGLADVEEDAGEQLQEEASEEDAEAEALLAGKFNLYQDIKDHLIERGIPADQIAFIHDAKNDEQKAKLFDAVREGKVRILLGSSAKMGVGTNVQKRLVAMHHIDAPWKPADVEQRDGRILRQGNKNPEIEIYRYVTKRSFDSYRWQILENKSHFIGQFRAGARGVRIATDIDAPLPEAAELKAAATGDPRIIEHADLSREVRVLDAQRAAHLGGAVRAKSALVQARARIESMRKHLEVYNQDAAKVRDLKGDNFSVALDLAKGTQTVTERKKAGEAVKAYLTSLAERSYYGAQDFDLGEISGFRMQGKVRKDSFGDGFVVKPEISFAGTYEGQEFALNAETNPVTLIQRYERLAGTPLERQAAANATVAGLEQEIPKLEAKTAATAFPKEAELADKRKRLNDLERALRPRDPAAQASEDAYVEQAMRNLKATSRTAAGVVDTSASAGKAGQMAEGLTGEGAAAAATRNFEGVIRSIYRNRDRIAGLSARELAQEIDQIAIAINKGILKEGALYRADDSTKFPYTAVADLGAAHQQFAQELSQRLNDPNADPVETAAWVEWRANLTDHFWADGVGKTSKALAAIPLMRANQPLPLYRSNKEFFANASRQQYNPSEGGSAYRDAAFDKFVDYYRSLMPGADPTLEEMERIGQEAFASPEYQAALAAAKAQPQTMPKEFQVSNPDIDALLAWSASRGIEANINATIDKARSYVAGGEVANERKAVVLLGLPGSGKSTISGGFANLTKSAVLNGDDTKEFIPEYANGLGSIAVHEEASFITKTALSRLMNEGANVVLEKTGSSPGSITGLINTLRGKGYSVQIVLADVPKALAMHQTVERFKKNGRVVPPDYFGTLNTNDVFAILKQEGAADGYTVVERKTAKGAWRFTARDSAFAGIADAIERSSGGIARVVRGGGEAGGQPVGPVREGAEGQGQVEPDDTSLLALDGILPEFTPQFQAAASEFAPALERELRAMLPGDIPVKMVDKLFRSGYAAYGGYDPLKRTIKVATRYGRGTATLKGFHEVGHALREYGRRFGEIAKGLYTAEEWTILTERARKTGIKVSNEIAYRSMYSKDIARERLTGDKQRDRMAELLDQERVFNLAEQWAAGTNFGAKVNTLLERIGLFFQAVGNALRGLGFQTANDVFQRMVSGEIAARAGQRQGAVSLPPVITPQEILLSSPEGQEALGSMGLMAIGEQSEGAGLAAIASSPTTPRPFTLSIDGRGEVSTREKEDGNRVRTYKVFGRETEAFILSEQPDGSWELSFFNGGKDSALIISDIESDLGNRIGPSGWLTPEAYEQWKATAPEKVADHQDVRGMWASPKALELAQAVAQAGGRELAALKSDEGGRIEPQLPWPTEGVRAASMPHPVKIGSQATTSSLEAPELGLSDLVEELTDTLGLTVRHGRLDPGLKARAGRAGARVFGQFSASTGITRAAIPNDFPVLVHEGGHALEVRPSTRDPLAQLKTTHAMELVPNNGNPTAEELSEGFAEWFRVYLTDLPTARATAPNFLKDFEDMLDAEEPGMLEALEKVQDGFQALLKASPAGAVRSRIQSTERPGKLGEIKEELQEKGFRKTLSDKLYSFFHSYADRWHGLKVAVEQMLREGGRQAGINLAEGEKLVLKAINDPYKRARLAAQAKAQATATLLNGVRLRGMADPVGPSYQDALDAAFGGNRRSQWNEEKAELFGSYLISRSMLAEFDRYDRGELENPPDQLIPRDVWAKAKDDIEKAHPEFARAAPILYQFQQNMLKLMYQEGFLTAEDYQTYSNRVDYVPRNRVMPDKSPSSVGAARGTNKRKVFMRFQGSTLDFINPLESIAQNVYAQQGRITLNGTIRALDNLARWAGPAGGPIAERLPARDMKGVRVDVREAMKDAVKQLNPDDAQDLIDMVDELFDEDAAATIFRATDINEKGEKIVYLYEDGKRVPIRMGDHDIGKDIFDAFTAVGTDNANMAFELATMGTQALRFGVTKAVSYVFNNFLRDQLQTWTLSENYTPFVTGTKGLKHVIANDDVSKRAAAFGVMMGGIDTNLQESAARDRDIKSLRRKGFWAVPLNWPRALHPVEWSWKAFMRTMEITEAGTRVGHMKAIQDRALADGMTPEEAAWEGAYGANDVMPFDRSGSKMMVIARLVAFLNAAVQGMSAAGRTISGERNTYTNYRDAVSPYLRAGMGQPVSVADRAAIPNAAKVWVKMLTMGIVGVSLAALYSGDDDESKEYQEFNDYMRATHWFFKINGTWWRFPKPFELAAISNAMEAGFAGYWKQDPRALKTFAQSLKHTMVPPHELQALKLYYEMMTGKDTFRDKDIVGGDLRALAPEYQFNAYTSELGRMVGKVMGWSPAQIDHFMAGALGTLGRDLLNASDYMLPRINKMTGGIIPGVSQTPRAEKSLEDMWFVSRFSRRAGRGALSVEEFWKQASRDGGKYTQAAETYKRLVAAGRADPRLNFEVKSFMERLTDDQKAYAYLEGGWFDEKDKDLHPVHRSRQVLQAISGIRKDILMDNLVKRSTVPDRRHKFREPEKVSLSPSDQRVVNEILEDLSMREARNALIVTGHPGWAQKEILGTDGLVKELRSKAPAVAEELEARLTKGRTKVVPFEKVQEAWPEARARILKEGPEASLADLRGYVPPSGTLEILITKPKPKRGGSLTIQ